MKGERLKKLAKLRLVLSVIAVLLALVMAVSGVMHFIVDKPAPEEPSPTETVETTTAPTETEAEATTEGNVEQTEASEETEPEGTVSGNQVVIEDPDGNTVDDDKKDKKPNRKPDKDKDKETTPPVDETTPPVVETTPPVVETKPPVVETKPPVVETKPPVVETLPPVVEDNSLSAFYGTVSVRKASLSGENGVELQQVPVPEKTIPWGTLFWACAVLLFVSIELLVLASARKKASLMAKLVLAPLAALLAVTMTMSGVLHFMDKSDAPPVEHGTSIMPAVAETKESTVWTEPEDAEAMEPEETKPVATEPMPGMKQGQTYVQPPSSSGDSTEPPVEGNGSNGGFSAKNQTPNNGANIRVKTFIVTLSTVASHQDSLTEDIGQALAVETTSETPKPTEAATETTAAAAETTAAAEEAAATEPVDVESGGLPWGLVFWISAALLAVDLIAILVISNSISQELKQQERTRKRIRRAHENAMQDERPMPDYRNPPQRQEKPSQPAAPGRNLRQTLPAPQVATIHQMGRREYQQDSLGHTAVLDDRGTLAVLADGMGGLSDGEKVSQKIVMDALTLGHQLTPGQVNGALRKMVSRINDDVNQMLGPDGLYKSGSTLVAVLVSDGQFQWISVGDSRIYLYRQGYASQLNQDHDQLQVWMADVLAGTRSMDEVLRNPDGRKLTSFIGMGQLKYVDGSLTPIALEPGDRLVLMSDGIYGAVSEESLAEVLKRYPDISQAASVIERMVREAKHPHQDNYTAIVLGF